MIWRSHRLLPDYTADSALGHSAPLFKVPGRCTAALQKLQVRRLVRRMQGRLLYIPKFLVLSFAKRAGTSDCFSSRRQTKEMMDD